MTPRSYFSGFQKKDVAFLHVSYRTLIEADLLFNLPATEQVCGADINSCNSDPQIPLSIP